MPETAPEAPTMPSHGLTNTPGSPSTGRAPGLSSRMKPSCKLLKRVVLASLRSGSENSRHVAIDTLRTSGCSIWLNQPMNRVARARGMRFVNRKLTSSCCEILVIKALMSCSRKLAPVADCDGLANHDRCFLRPRRNGANPLPGQAPARPVASEARVAPRPCAPVAANCFAHTLLYLR